MEQKFITLPDGRKMGYFELGNPGGHPVFYFHGAPSSALEPLVVDHQLFLANNLRIISPDRPGIGGSDIQKNRTFKDWPADVIALADHLGLDKFSILGNSGGGQYVIACAALIPERLRSAVVIAGGWQMNMPEAKKHLKFPYSMFWFVAANLPFMLPVLLGSMKSNPKESKEKSLKQAQKMMAPPDFEVLKKGETAEQLSKALDASLKNKKGVVMDLRLYLKKSEFNLSEISYPITFYHGEQDKNLPVEIARKMVAELPNGKLIIFKDEAHLSTLCNHFDDAAKSLLNFIS